ncbi:hypothetical protein PENSPDRAFT_48216 [Peniophora sp. CONT]|nr:hypothetical protein PENSPDRAFT_48216 [Peniophora sp. CONT]
MRIERCTHCRRNVLSCRFRTVGICKFTYTTLPKYAIARVETFCVLRHRRRFMVDTCILNYDPVTSATVKHVRTSIPVGFVMIAGVLVIPMSPYCFATRDSTKSC